MFGINTLKAMEGLFILKYRGKYLIINEKKF